MTVSAATFSRLEQANPFNKRRVAEQALEVIRVAVYTMYPPRTPEEWKDRSRYQGAGRNMLVLWYDLVCYPLRKLIGRADELGSYTNNVAKQPVQITLKIPIELVKWIEKIARDRQSTLPDATNYAIEYGFRVLDSQEVAEGAGENLRKGCLAILRAIRERKS